MAGVLSVYEGVVARRCHRHRTRPCVFVCCAFYCCCCCCCCCAGVYCVASVDVQSLVQFLSRFRIVTASFTAVGIPTTTLAKKRPGAPVFGHIVLHFVALHQSSRSDQPGVEQLRKYPAQMTWVPAENGRKVMWACLLYTSPSPRDGLLSRMPSSA